MLKTVMASTYPIQIPTVGFKFFYYFSRRVAFHFDTLFENIIIRIKIRVNKIALILLLYRNYNKHVFTWQDLPTASREQQQKEAVP
jgi:hypothetical protein